MLLYFEKKLRVKTELSGFLLVAGHCQLTQRELTVENDRSLKPGEKGRKKPQIFEFVMLLLIWLIHQSLAACVGETRIWTGLTVRVTAQSQHSYYQLGGNPQKQRNNRKDQHHLSLNPWAHCQILQALWRPSGVQAKKQQ